MAPKKRFTPDWSWVGTTVQTSDQITLEHRRQAAGLTDLTPCSYNFELGGSPVLHSQGYSDIEEVDKNGKPKLGRGVKTKLKVPGCTPKGCKGNPVCYNHFGADKILDLDAEKVFLNEHAGRIEEPRDGPAGLRNLGATCYANAFLQLWYHNVTFRNGVYDCVTSESTPLYHLANVFGMLQHSNRAIVDPMGLIDALRLGKGEQQDAAEFSKLFMSVLAGEFSKHPDPKMRTFLTEQFEGKMQYVTECDCGHRSFTESTFLELELSLKDKSDLETCLKAMRQSEILDGDNMYQCPACMQARRATRTSVPVHMPPVLHLSLMRFVFDFKSMSRKKSKDSITYPKSIILGSSVYELRGVITHQGASAHHGHFTCEVYDESEQVWLLCNDEEITNLTEETERPKKKPRITHSLASSSDKPGEQTSLDAYMLVYKRRDGDLPPIDPPDIVAEKVWADNIAFDEESNEIGVKREILTDEFGHIQGAKKEVLRHLFGTDHIVPREALVKWFDASTFAELCESFDMSPIMCAHGGIDPERAEDCRLISAEAFDRLHLLNEVPNLDICAVCVEERFELRLEENEQQAMIDKFFGKNKGDQDWVLPAAWLDQWKRSTLPKDALPTTEEYTLYCEHDGRAILPKSGAGAKKVTFVTGDALALVRSVVGEFRAFQKDEEDCAVCEAALELDGGAREARKNDVKKHKAIQRHLDPSTRAFELDYYALSRRFVDEWKAYVSAKGGDQEPVLDMGLCEHGMLDYNPEMERPHLITEQGWKLLCEKYGETEPIVIQFEANAKPGKKFGIHKISHQVCHPCRIARLSTYDTVTVPIIASGDRAVDNKPTFPPMNGFIRAPRMSRTSRSGSGNVNGSYKKQWSIDASKSTSVKELKIALMGMTKLSPISQRLTYAGRELSSEETLQSMGYLEGDELRLEELGEDVDMDVDLDEIVDGSPGRPRPRAREGFGGTALLARIACPQCTFENDGGSRKCAMCEEPFESVPMI